MSTSALQGSISLALVLARRSQACGRFGDLWQSYCDADDFFCDRGDSVPTHLGYVKKYSDDIVNFVVKNAEEAWPEGWDFQVKSNEL